VGTRTLGVKMAELTEDPIRRTRLLRILFDN